MESVNHNLSNFTNLSHSAPLAPGVPKASRQGLPKTSFSLRKKYAPVPQWNYGIFIYGIIKGIKSSGIPQNPGNMGVKAWSDNAEYFLLRRPQFLPHAFLGSCRYFSIGGALRT